MALVEAVIIIGNMEQKEVANTIGNMAQVREVNTTGKMEREKAVNTTGKMALGRVVTTAKEAVVQGAVVQGTIHVTTMLNAILSLHTRAALFK